MMRRIGAVILVMGAVGLFARAAGLPQASAQSSSSPEVRVLERGAQPRKKLRYNFREGMEEEMVMDMDMSMKMSMGGRDMPRVDVPTMRMTMSLESDRIHSNGDLRYKFRTDSADIVGGGNQRMVAMLKRQLDKITGITGWVRVSSRGVTRDADVSLPSGAGPQLKRLVKSMRRSMRQMSAPLPKGPVGAGARWQAKMPIEMKNIEVQQKAVYELEELDGNEGKLKVSIEQTAEPQQISAPGMPAGAQVHLDSMRSEGSGRMSFDLDRLTPTSNIQVSTRMESSLQARGNTRQMDTDMKVDAKIRPGS